MFRFTIRELLLCTVVVALAVGWWIERRQMQRQAEVWEYRAGAAKEIASFGGCEIDWDSDGVRGSFADGGHYWLSDGGGLTYAN